MLNKITASLHFIVIAFAYTSPLYLGWRILLFFLLLFYAQNFLFGGCIFTKMQFGTFKESYILHYLGKMGISPDREKARIVFTYLIPLFIFFLAFVYQTFLLI